MHTLYYSFSQLDRLQDIIDAGQPIRIIHTMLDDSSPYEDRYIVLIDCTDQLYTLLLMI